MGSLGDQACPEMQSGPALPGQVPWRSLKRGGLSTCNEKETQDDSRSHHEMRGRVHSLDTVQERLHSKEVTDEIIDKVVDFRWRDNASAEESNIVNLLKA